MRQPIAMMAAVLALASPVLGQQTDAPAAGKVTAPPRNAFAPTPPSGASRAGTTAQAKTGTGDARLYRAGAALPEPTPEGELAKPKITLPAGPIEPFLIQKENGPFMVLAYTFRGPDAAKYAQTLVMELRNAERLPAYIFFAKVHPGNSNIRNVQPTAPPFARNGDMAPPEKFRNYDEAAVLVGDCKTIEESKELLHRVKKIRPVCVDSLPTIYNWRVGRGLSRAMLTTNPLCAAQNLYPGKNVPVVKVGQAFDPSVVTASFATPTIHKADRLVKQINTGPHNIYKCRGPFVLLVAEFSGGVADTTGQKVPESRVVFRDRSGVAKSPLAEAGEKAEKLAEVLSKSKTLRSVGGDLQPFTYHDRYASRVYIGPFKSGDDPALIALLKDPVTGSLTSTTPRRGDETRVSKIVELSNELLLQHKWNLFLSPTTELTAVGKD